LGSNQTHHRFLDNLDGALCTNGHLCPRKYGPEAVLFDRKALDQGCSGARQKGPPKNKKPAGPNLFAQRQVLVNGLRIWQADVR
jgi:hypothetical protein